MNLPVHTFGEYPPILSFGFHVFTIEGLRTLCVDQFPNSTTRGRIMSGLEQIAGRLSSANGLAGDLWVDGSFLTKKIDPGDADIVFHACVGVGVDLGDADHVQVLQWINSNLKIPLECDSYICLRYVTGAPAGATPQYWHKQFGYSRGSMSKGIAVVKIGGGL